MAILATIRAQTVLQRLRDHARHLKCETMAL